MAPGAGHHDYVSPEQALGHPVTGQSDLLRWACVLYEMLTGEVPFRGESPVAVAMRTCARAGARCAAARPEASAATAAVLDRAVAKDLEQRYPTRPPWPRTSRMCSPSGLALGRPPARSPRYCAPCRQPRAGACPGACATPRAGSRRWASWPRSSRFALIALGRGSATRHRRRFGRPRPPGLEP